MVRHRDLPAAPLALLLMLLTCLAALTATPALAITGGSDTNDPDGVRRVVVQILGPNETCTGTIVGPTKIVSAAHCFASTNPRDYTVMVLDRSFHRVAVKVAAVRVHPAFDRQALQAGRRINDLAVVRTAEPLPGDVGRAALGGFGGGGAVTAAGFGQGGGWFSHGLRQVDLTALDPRPTAMGDIILGPAKAGLAGACAGDSGGPILRRSGHGYVLVGVISWTAGQCGSTTAVTPVSMYQPFLAR